MLRLLLLERLPALVGVKIFLVDELHSHLFPERLRASFNPLGAISINDPTGREDIEVIADGLVKRSDPQDEEWYSGAVSILAGLMAYVVESAPPDHRNFAAVRSILLQTDDALKDDAERMLSSVAFLDRGKERRPTQPAVADRR